MRLRFLSTALCVVSVGCGSDTTATFAGDASTAGASGAASGGSFSTGGAAPFAGGNTSSGGASASGGVSSAGGSVVISGGAAGQAVGGAGAFGVSSGGGGSAGTGGSIAGGSGAGGTHTGGDSNAGGSSGMGVGGAGKAGATSLGGASSMGGATAADGKTGAGGKLGSGGTAGAGGKSGMGGISGAGGATNGPPPTVEQLMPLAVGDVWNYRTTILPGTTSTMPCPAGMHATTITGTAMFMGESAFTATHFCAPTVTRYYVESAKGLEVDVGTGWSLVLPRPITDDETFMAASSTEVIAHVADVTVPAGTFSNCWATQYLTATGPMATYCAGVGLVSLEYDAPSGGGYLVELTSYTVK